VITSVSQELTATSVGKIAIILAWSVLCVVVCLFFHVQHEVSMITLLREQPDLREDRRTRLGCVWPSVSLRTLEKALPKTAFAFASVIILCSYFATLYRWAMNIPSTQSVVSKYETFRHLLVIIFGTLLYPAMVMFGVENMVPFALCVIQSALVFALAVKPVDMRHNDDGRYHLNDITACCLVWISGLVGFYNTGHRSNLTSVPVSAAFVATDSFSIAWSFPMVFIHTFVFLIIAIFQGAFIIAARATSEHITFRISKFVLCLMMVATIRNFCSQLSLIILRHHIAQWTVFSPRFLYDGLELFVVHIVGLIVAAISSTIP